MDGQDCARLAMLLQRLTDPELLVERKDIVYRASEIARDAYEGRSEEELR